MLLATSKLTEDSVCVGRCIINIFDDALVDDVDTDAV